MACFVDKLESKMDEKGVRYFGYNVCNAVCFEVVCERRFLHAAFFLFKPFLYLLFFI